MIAQTPQLLPAKNY